MKRSSSSRTAAAACVTDDPFAGIDLAQVADNLRAVAHPDRLRLVALLQQAEWPVGGLAQRLGLPQPAVSGHLRILQARGLLTCQRRGTHSFYRIANPALADICACIRTHFGSCRAPAARSPR